MEEPFWGAFGDDAMAAGLAVWVSSAMPLGEPIDGMLSAAWQSPSIGDMAPTGLPTGPITRAVVAPMPRTPGQAEFVDFEHLLFGRGVRVVRQIVGSLPVTWEGEA